MDETTIETHEFIEALATRIGVLEKENIALTIVFKKQEGIIASLKDALLSAMKKAETTNAVDVD